MRIVTWNINSLRLRLPHLRTVDQTLRPDIICLQETKVENGSFPLADVEQIGYSHIAFNGIKSYNGVAILSRLPFEKTGHHDWTGKQDARHIWASLENGVEVHNLYVPAGGYEPDPVKNPKYAHKLAFVEEMASWFVENRDPSGSLVLVGDLNIAPLEHDVWSHEKMVNVVSHTPAEVTRFLHAQTVFTWQDIMRQFIPAEEKLYSWWSYRSPDWQATDKGRRLDHIWATPALAAKARGLRVLKDARSWERPSDHVPVCADFDL